MSFGEKLRQARKKRGLTQKALAMAISAKHNSISNWEAGKNQPDSETIRQLCRALEVDPNYFFEADAWSQQLSGVEFALFGEVRELSEQDKQDVLEFIRFKKGMQEKRRGQCPNFSAYMRPPTRWACKFFIFLWGGSLLFPRRMGSSA